MFNLMNIASSGLAAANVELSVTANNLANINTTSGPNGQPFQEQSTILQSAPAAGSGPDAGVGQGVEVAAIVASNAPYTPVYDPTSPLANAQGDVLYPNVSLQTEMPNLIQASAAYNANATAFTAAKTIDQKALTL